VIRGIRENPYSRRHVINAWDPSTPAAIPPCHVLYQFHVNEDKLSVQMYQRSADLFLGVPFNIASTALLTHLIANECQLNVGTLKIVFGDVHVYESHVDAVRAQLQRKPRALPTLTVHRKPDGLWNVQADEMRLHDYTPCSRLRAEMIA
jgi:thymidylate synthase